MADDKHVAALEALADVVGDLVTEPDVNPELRAAWITYREAERS